MKLHLKFVDEWMIKSESRGSTPLFIIYWELEGLYYPCEEWVDLGALILDWWILALERIKRGSRREDLVFREGPYRLKLTANSMDDTIIIATENQSILTVVPLAALICELKEAAKVTVKKLKELGMGKQSQIDLTEGIRILGQQ